MLLGPPAHLPAADSTPPVRFADNFSPNLAQWSVEQMPGGRVEIHDGALVIEDAGGTTGWFRPRLTAPVEITYYVGYGGNNNTTTRFRRYDGTSERPLLPAHDRHAPDLLLKANHVCQIKLIARNGTAEFWRDGELIFSHADPSPLTSGYFAFRTVRSHLVIRNFRVQSAAPAP